ncbi:hypothetical protein Agub_g142 [Astrephomene gubernaculifera]|uniref:Uncharacterized protein n=1 Tax=Astrephomene gubernaculifera TaxID=47775 RepID=A0AAD3DD86_9CHLO|nr:hypothetical protein Agub_g142 [Astrephomene gubernaculifera]
MPTSIMPSTLPAIVSPKVGTDLGNSYTDDRGFALSGLTAASAALRGALFDSASVRNTAAALAPPNGPTSSRPLSAASIALLLSQAAGPGQPLLPGSGSARGPGATSVTGPGSILGFLGPGVGSTGSMSLSGGIAGVAASGPGGSGAAGGSGASLSGGMVGGGGGGGGSGGGAAPAADVAAVQSAAALRAAAEALVGVLEAAVRAREAQNRAMLAATRESLPPSATTAATTTSSTSRPASARALDRALYASRSLLSGGGAGPGGSVADERLAWVRQLVRQTEGGQSYAVAAEERERERIAAATEAAAAAAGGSSSSTAAEAASGLAVRRGPLPSLQRPSRREDVLLLQSWLADTLQRVLGAAAAKQAAAGGSGATGDGALGMAAFGGFGGGGGAGGGSRISGNGMLGTGAGAGAGSSSGLGRSISGGLGLGGLAAGGDAPQQLQQAGAAATSGAGVVGEAGGQSQHAADLADAALYVLGVAMEELRRQVAAECKERGELLSLLSEQQADLLALRGALAGEGRAAEVAGQWAALLAERERALGTGTGTGATAPASSGAAAPAASSLQEEPQSQQQQQQEGSAAAAAAAGGVHAGSSQLASQLVLAQQAAAAAERRFGLADAALAGEVARRAAAEQQLEVSRELLRRQENEWLHHRSANQRLEAEVTSLRDQLEAARRAAAVAEAAVEAAREQNRNGRDDVSQLEAALFRMRQQYEGNEILVVAQRQQVRELEAALAALREQHREQALALGKVGQVTEQYEEAAANLRADLAAEQTRSNELETQLIARTSRLSEVETSLAASDKALAAVREVLASTEALANKQASEADAAARRMKHELADAVAARRQEETRREELEKESVALVEQVKMLGRTLALQGLEGVPGVHDKSWDSGGPLGAAQRVLALTSQQLGNLHAHGEELARQGRNLQNKLKEEKETNTKLQRDLYEARTIEARMLREKEISDMRVATLEHDLRAAQSDVLKSRASAVDSEARIKVQHETIVALQAQARELTPLKKRVEALTTDLEQTRRMEEEARATLEATRVNLEQSVEQSRFYQREIQKLLGELEAAQAEMRGLRVQAAKLAEQEAANKELEERIEALQHQLDLTAESHTETLKQLELAKFFLQGLDHGASPNSPARSSLSTPSRERIAQLMSPGHTQRSPHRGTRTLSQSGRFGSPQARSFRTTGIASGHLDDASSLVSGSMPTLDGVGEDAAARPFSAIGRAGVAPPARGRPNWGGGPGGRSFATRPSSAAALGSSSREGLSPVGSPSPVASRPVSGVIGSPGVEDEDSMYRTEVPNEVMEIIESRGLANRLTKSNVKWANVKIGIMAWFSNKLRAKLQTVTEQLAAKDLEIAQLHFNYLTEMRLREEFLCQDVLPTLMPPVQAALEEAVREVKEVRSQLPGTRRDMDALAGSCAVMAFSLKGFREREAHAVCRGMQTESEAPEEWSRYLVSLPPLPPRLVLSLGSLADAIVRIYLRAAGTVESLPTWGPPRHDTIHDAIMDHYTSQRAPGSYNADLLSDPHSPVARLLGSALQQARNTKVAIFLYFLNMSPEGVHWPSPAWHFFLQVLHCLRVLLSGTWRVVARRWAAPEGVQIPMPAVLDLVGNIFNVQVPAELDGAVSVRLAAIVTPGSAGPAVDLDALLLMLVREYNAGNCPRAALLYPRRLTDGQLFNIFNSAGHNEYVDTLKTHEAEKYIGPTAPASPTAGLKRMPLPPQLQQLQFNGIGSPVGGGGGGGGGLRVALQQQQQPGSRPLSPGTLVDVLHPYGDMGGEGGGVPSIFSNLPDLSPPRQQQQQQQSSAQQQGLQGQGQQQQPPQQLQQQSPSPLLQQLQPPGGGGGGGGGGGAAGSGPDGSLTISFEISHETHMSAVTGTPPPAVAAGGGGRLTALPPPPGRPRK